MSNQTQTTTHINSMMNEITALKMRVEIIEQTLMNTDTENTYIPARMED